MSIFTLLKFCATTIIVACLVDMLVTRSIQNSSFLSRFAPEFQENEWSKQTFWRWFGLIAGKNTLDFMSSRALFFPIAELIFPLSLVTSLYLYGFSFLILSNIVFSIFVILIFVINLRTRLVPHIISIPGILLGIGLGLIRGWHGLIDSALGALVNFGLFLFLYYLGVLFARFRAKRMQVTDDEEVLGAGAVIAAIMTGAFCGYPLALTASFLSFLLIGIKGIVAVVFIALLRRYKQTSSVMVYINFADMIVLSGAIVMFVAPLFPK